MSDKPWKVMERRIAKAFGTVRNSLSGSRSKAGTSSDTLHPRLYIECKRQKRIAVLGWMAEVEEKAKKERVILIGKSQASKLKKGKIPVLVLKGVDKKGDYILVKLRDLQFIAKEEREKRG